MKFKSMGIWVVGFSTESNDETWSPHQIYLNRAQVLVKKVMVKSKGWLALCLVALCIVLHTREYVTHKLYGCFESHCVNPPFRLFVISMPPNTCAAGETVGWRYLTNPKKNICKIIPYSSETKPKIEGLLSVLNGNLNGSRVRFGRYLGSSPFGTSGPCPNGPAILETKQRGK